MSLKALFFIDEEAKVQSNKKKKSLRSYSHSERYIQVPDLLPKLPYCTPLVISLRFPVPVGNENLKLLYYLNLAVFF